MDRLNSEVKKEINSLDFTTKEHSKRCAEIADKVASYLGYDEKDRSFLVNAAAIHDVGKRFIPEEILNKDGPLTENERVIINKHTVYGYIFCIKNEVLREYADVASHHHERLNGTGYPDKLTAEQIPEKIRIISAIDVYEAVTSPHRPYRDSVSHKEAVEILKSNVERCELEQKVTDVVIKVNGIELERKERIEKILSVGQYNDKFKIGKDPNVNEEYKRQANLILKKGEWKGISSDIEVSANLLKMNYSKHQIIMALKQNSPEIPGYEKGLQLNYANAVLKEASRNISLSKGLDLRR